MRKVLILGAALLLGGCSYFGGSDSTETILPPAAPMPAAAPAAAPVMLSPEQLEMVYVGVRSKLGDQGSAQFETVQATRDTAGNVVACGWVVAPASFGANAPRQPFSGMFMGNPPRGFSPSGVGGGPADPGGVYEVCRQFGIVL